MADDRQILARGTPPERPRVLFFKGPVSGPTVLMALRAIGVLYVSLPAFVLCAFLFHGHLRSPAALYVGCGLMVLVSVANVTDLVRIQRHDLTHLSASRAFAESCVSTVALGSLVVAVGVHEGAFLLLPLLPFLGEGLFGNLRIIGLGWLLLLGVLGTATGLQLGAADAAWLTAVFGAFALAVCLALHLVAGESIERARSGEAVSTVAVEAGLLQRWPDDLEGIGPRLAEAMDAREWLVATQEPGASTVTVAYGWPAPPTIEILPALAALALAAPDAVRRGGWLAAGAVAGEARVVVVVPARSRAKVPADPVPLRIVAATLAGMLDRCGMVASLEAQARTDELTGLPNRRVLQEIVQRELAAGRRTGRPLTVAVLDIDRFKSYNDRFGHGVGDDLLRSFGALLRRRIRERDLASRVGGEEFVVVLPDTDGDGAARLLEELRRGGAGVDPAGGRVSFSGGVACWNGEEGSEALIGRADRALYEAKHSGRDRLVFARADAAGRGGGPARAGDLPGAPGP